MKIANFKRIVTFSMVLILLVSILAPLPGPALAAENEGVDPESLKGCNWMSLISNDRYLNEVNIPGTHDAGMAQAKPYGLVGKLGPSYGRTQSLSVRDQMNDGVRMLDIRMTNRYGSQDTSDDIYIVHGSEGTFDARFYSYKSKKRIKAKRSSYYKYTYYTVNDLMAEVSEFLKNNPSETILLEMGYEYNSGDEDKTYSKAQKLLDQYAATINPSTGKPYIYTDNGSKIINNMPTMGQARGQIVVLSKNTGALGYGIQYSAPNGYAINTKVAGKIFCFENHYEADKSHKLDYVKNFFNGGTVNKWPTSGKQAYGTDSIKAQIHDLPKDVTTHIDKGNIISTSSNVAWADWKKLGDNPQEVADVVNPYLYGSDGLFNTRGKLYGWVYSDYVNAQMARKLYLTNFPTGADGLNYKKVTYKIGTEEKTTYVLNGEEITLPDSTQTFAEGITFDGWTKDGDPRTVYKVGAKLKITEDTVFNAHTQYTWKGLNQYLSKQQSGTVDIKLSGDLISTEADETLTIPSGVTVNIDVDGYKIDGTKKSSDRPNFTVYGKLNIVSSNNGNGIITGGKSEKGGAFYVAPGGELTVGNNILITGNKASYGGGIYLNNAQNGKSAAKAVIKNATITNNEATYGSGGGVYAPDGTTVELSGKVIITNNTGKIYRSGVSNLHVDKSDTPIIYLTGNLQTDSDIGISAYLNHVNNTEMPIGYDNNSGSYVNGSKDYFKSDYAGNVIGVGTGDNANKLVIKPFKTYTVTFFNSYKIPDQTVVAGSKATKPKDTPFKPNYRFTNWIIDNDPDKPYDFNTPVNSNLSLYPNYVPYFVYVSFYHNDASGQISSRCVQYDTAISSMPDNPIYKGYSFAGWYKDKELTQAFDPAENITSNITLYGKWNKQPDVTLTFDTGGGSVVQPQTIEYGSTATRPANPTRPGKLFTGWFTDSLCANAFDFSTPITANTTIYARWETDPAITTNYVVAFDSNGGSNTPSQTISSGGLVTKPTDPTKTGYAFRNWYTDPACTNVYNFSKPVTSDMILYAGWYKVERVVTFNSNGGSLVDSQRLANGETAYYMESTKQGYTFLGWYTDEQLTNEYDFDTPVTNSITLYAKWIQQEMTVTFDSMGGSDVAEDYPKWGGIVAEPEVPVREGYNFLGWYTDSECTTKYNFNTPVKKDITLYAKWEKGPEEETYDVTFDTSGGTAVSPKTNLSYGTLLDLTTVTTSLEDYDFVGWYMQLGGMSADDLRELIKDNPDMEEYTWIDNETPYILSENNYYVDGDANFKARFEKQLVTLSFYDGEDLVETQTATKNFIPLYPEEISKAGYSFVDWYSDPDLVYLFDFDAPIDENTNAYAKWEQEEYTITFDSNGGTPVESQDIQSDEKVKEPTKPTRGDDEFLGWYTPVTDDPTEIDYILEECSDEKDQFVVYGRTLYHEYDFDNEIVDEDIELVAMWDDQEIYRLFNPYTSEHLYTTNQGELFYLTSIGWNFEGVAWVSPTQGDPVYRLFNPYTYEHFYTLNKDEKDYLVTLGWSYEGIVWYSNNDKEDEGQWVYRLFNPYESIGAHLYTLNKGEIDYLVSLGWIYEGTCWKTVD